MKDTLKSFKIYLGKMSKKMKTGIAVTAVAVSVGAIVLTSILNHKDYVVLFSGVTAEETTEIVSKLQEMGVEYTSSQDGDIRVPEETADTTRAKLAYEGYPKSGFTYDVFTQNAGGMTTDMEKQTYKLYELQNRIGATIRLFSGVKDARVTIALGDEQKYVLESTGDGDHAPSASVVVIMEEGGTPSARQAAGIARLVARSVPDMPMENVSVLDGNGIEVAGTAGAGSGTTGEEIAQLIETQIAKKVVHVLEPFYGAENIRVSARGTVNMEKVVREETTYSTPEKIDEKDKTGIVSGESIAKETSGQGTTAGGTAGTETNADVSQYTANAGEGTGGYVSESQTKEYLVNQIKEQGEIDPGVLQDLTVSVSINGKTLGNISNDKLLELIGNATGIAADQRKDKIAIAVAPFYENVDVQEVSGQTKLPEDEYLKYLLIAAGVLLLLFMITVISLIFSRKKKKKRKQKEVVFDQEDFTEAEAVPEEVRKAKPEILNMQNEKSRELRENVRDFAEENPEISAQMIKRWLRGGEENGRGA